MKKRKLVSLAILATLLIFPTKLLTAQSEEAVNKQLFEITRVGHIKTGKKKLTSKDKKFKVQIRSNYDMGNATIILWLNGKKVKHQMKEVGTEQTGGKVVVVTGVIYDIIGECKDLLQEDENELVIRGYGTPQKRLFNIEE